jgi:hypothetical protein
MDMDGSGTDVLGTVPEIADVCVAVGSVPLAGTSFGVQPINGTGFVGGALMGLDVADEAPARRAGGVETPGAPAAPIEPDGLEADRGSVGFEVKFSFAGIVYNMYNPITANMTHARITSDRISFYSCS